MTRQTLVLTVLLLLAGGAMTTPAHAQQPPTGPGVGLPGIILGLNLSDAQRAAITQAIEAHRPAMQAARLSGDLDAVREARRAFIKDVVNVLTPEQRDQVKAAVRKRLQQAITP
jgi:Spy/CpxP family protein refolding chaperone